MKKQLLLSLLATTLFSATLTPTSFAKENDPEFVANVRKGKSQGSDRFPKTGVFVLRVASETYFTDPVTIAMEKVFVQAPNGKCGVVVDLEDGAYLPMLANIKECVEAFLYVFDHPKAEQANLKGLNLSNPEQE